MKGKLLLAMTLLLGFIASGCTNAGDSGQGVSAPSPRAPSQLDFTPPPQVNELLDLNLSGAEVTEAIALQDPEAPDFLKSFTTQWFIPSLHPAPTESEVRSFVMPDQYEDAGLSAVAWNIYGPSPGSMVGSTSPFEIMSGIAEFEDSEGAEKALPLGARIYGVSSCCSILSEPAREGVEISNTYQISGLGPEAIANLITHGSYGQITAISVRNANRIGTVIVRYSRDAIDVLSVAEALAAVLADHLTMAP